MRELKFSFNAFLLVVLIFTALTLFITVIISHMADRTPVNDFYPIDGTEYMVHYSNLEPDGIYSGTIGKASGAFLNNRAFSDYCLLAPDNGKLDITIVVYCYDKVLNPGIVSIPTIENSTATDQRIALTASHLAIV